MKLIIIGSAPDVHIRLSSNYVSGYHAELLLLDNGDIFLTDKASLNGTFLNGKRIQPNQEVSVKRGDDIRLADMPLNWGAVPAMSVEQGIREIRGIGTNFRNKYQLKGDRVSRFHATLKLKSDNKWYIQDHSKNGTAVNGIPLISNQDFKLKKSDRIVCAGVDVPNPYTGKVSSATSSDGDKPNVRRMIYGLITFVAIVGILLGLFKTGLLKDCSRSASVVSDSEIYNRYKGSIALMSGAYHYHVSVEGLDLEGMGWPTELIVNRKGQIEAVSADGSNVTTYTGTGFFVSEDGMMVTNLHIARPWLFEKEADIIADFYKTQFADLSGLNSRIGKYMDQVKVEGVLDYLGFIPNGDYFTSDNVVKCVVLGAGDDTNVDVAIVQSVRRRLPEGVTSYVDLSQAVCADKDIHVGEHIYTMGFPMGLTLQNLESANGIQLLARGGSITQPANEYTFGFDAASYGGASGSPIFNERGQLVGVLNAGVAVTQGFNIAVKAVYAKELYDKVAGQH